MNRRKFSKGSALSGSALLLAEAGKATAEDRGFPNSLPPRRAEESGKLLDLNPARWIWYPSGRCLPNTFFYSGANFRFPNRSGRPRAGLRPTAATNSRSMENGYNGGPLPSIPAGWKSIRWN